MAMTTLAVSVVHSSALAAGDRNRATATAIGAARHGRMGTRKRAGALLPPHHMYSRVVLPTWMATAASRTAPSKRHSRWRSISQAPAAEKR